MSASTAEIDYAAHLATLGQFAAEQPDLASFQDRVVDYLHESVGHYTWVGFYMREGETLALGAYRGSPTPHTRIPIDQGICGAAVREGVTIVVDDVQNDPRYLACSLETQSEIVVPLFKQGIAVGELDLDSDQPAAFTDDDRSFLEAIAKMVEALL
ncbi:MAG: GAF domain-containing protein [bacterium]